MTCKFRGRILIVDDDVPTGLLYQAALEADGFVVDVAHSLTEVSLMIKRHIYDIALVDFYLDEESGLTALDLLLKETQFTKVVVMSSRGAVKVAVESMRRGASGFFEKGEDLTQVFKHFDMLGESNVAQSQCVNEFGLVGHSPGLMSLIDTIKQLKDVDSTVLILGESGSGKELVARAIHQISKRRSQRFDAINCGAIPDNLLESELFGHKRGAFTDAKCDRKGIFELCSEGTLLLDEIGDMPLALQMKLLRVLQERSVTPIGSSTALPINTRVIAATHHNVLADTRAKLFREDLYFRLSIIVLRIPPLRERKEDIPDLCAHFLAQFNQQLGRSVGMPDASALALLASYDWPGNVRELRNAMERCVVLADGVDFQVRHAFLHTAPLTSPDAQAPHAPKAELSSDHKMAPELLTLSLTDAKHSFEKYYLQHHISECRGKVAVVARRAGRLRSNVYRLLKRYGIEHLKV